MSSILPQGGRAPELSTVGLAKIGSPMTDLWSDLAWSNPIHDDFMGGWNIDLVGGVAGADPLYMWASESNGALDGMTFYGAGC